MTDSALLTGFRTRGIKLSVTGDELRVEAPAGVITAELRQELTANKQSLIALLKAEQGPDLVHRSPEAPIHLSHFQERLWVLQQLSRESTEYNIVTAWPMGDDHSVADYVRAVADVCHVHSVLRTCYAEAEDGLSGRRLPSAQVDIASTDLSDLDVEEQHLRIMAEIERHRMLPFVLTEEPPVRFCVFDLGSNGAAVLISAHHIALDHWSLSLLQTCIRQAAADPGYRQKALALEYSDYSAWSRAGLEAQRIQPHIDWWAAQLENSPDLSSFPSDFTPELVGTGDSISFSWDPELSAGIQALARDEGASVYMCLVAACAVALHGYTGQNDLLLGNSVAVRDRPELEDIIGPFVNTEVLRLLVEGEMRFKDVLASAKACVLDSYPHCHVPFEMVVDRLQPARSMNRSPLFQVAVVLQNAGEGQSQPIFGGGAVHDMTWFTHMRDNRLVGSIEYRSDIFSRISIERVLQSLEMILRAATRNPELCVADIPLISPDSKKELEIIAAGPDVPGHAPLVIESFEEICAAHSDNIAVRFEDQQITYGTLNEKANRLAHHLMSLGIGRGDLVGLCLDRSLDLSVAQLAILKAGAALVPIDPGFPPARVSYLLSDSVAAAILTDAEVAPSIEVDTNTTHLIICRNEAEWAAQPGENPALQASAQDRAQVIYTSGSTGAPKGVQLTHGAIANLFRALRNAPGMSSDDVVAATTTVSFDISAVELLLPLTVGARMELLSRDVATDGYALSDALAQTRATVVQATPSAWRLLLEAEWQGSKDICAITGGEPLTRDLADQLLERVGKLWNGYGPSETTIYSTATFIEPGPEPISIGRPLDNTSVFILNENQRLAPIGVQGEICIGGAGVAVGYLGRDQLTVEKFIPNPFGEGQLYRTGDIGRWSVSGELMHLGRMDDQVKIRGVRVELGEIEATLSQIPGISKAAAGVYDADGDDRRLVAYVMYDWAHELTPSDIRRALRATLPGFMIPSVIVDLPEFPMTPNGKLDRKALPNPFDHRVPEQAFEAPHEGMEEMLAQIWQSVLGVEQVGAQDNFFEIGGHSLLTLRVARQVHEQLGIELDPRVMFFQNLRQISAKLSQDV